MRKNLKIYNAEWSTQLCMYFSQFKERQIKEKLAKYICDCAGVPRGFGQNPVEWLHYMSKLEVDAEGNGVKHRNVRLTTAVSSLKNRVLVAVHLFLYPGTRKWQLPMTTRLHQLKFLTATALSSLPTISQVWRLSITADQFGIPDDSGWDYSQLPGQRYD